MGRRHGFWYLGVDSSLWRSIEKCGVTRCHRCHLGASLKDIEVCCHRCHHPSLERFHRRSHFRSDGSKPASVERPVSNQKAVRRCRPADRPAPSARLARRPRARTGPVRRRRRRGRGRGRAPAATERGRDRLLAVSSLRPPMLRAFHRLGRSAMPQMSLAHVSITAHIESGVDAGGEAAAQARCCFWSAVEDSAATAALASGLLGAYACRSRGGGECDRRVARCYTARSEAPESEA